MLTWGVDGSVWQFEQYPWPAGGLKEFNFWYQISVGSDYLHLGAVPLKLACTIDADALRQMKPRLDVVSIIILADCLQDELAGNVGAGWVVARWHPAALTEATGVRVEASSAPRQSQQQQPDKYGFRIDHSDAGIVVKSSGLTQLGRNSYRRNS